MMVTVTRLLVILSGLASSQVVALNPEQTEGLIKVAREHKRGSGTVDSHTHSNSHSTQQPDLTKATQLYKTIIEQGEGPSVKDAMFELASINTQSPSENFVLLSKASELGHPMAQHQLSAALFTGIGIGGLVPRDPGRALVLEQFSALSGTPEAHLGMGYRHIMGEGVPKSCEKALPYLEFAANEAAWQTEEHQYNLFVEHSYLAREVEAGLSAGGGIATRGEITTDMVNYYEHLAAEHDHHAVLSLVQIYAHGSKEVYVDMPKVRKYLRIAAIEFNMSSAAGQLGYMLATGMGKDADRKKNGDKQSYEDSSEATDLLRLAYNSHDSWGVLGMGYCYYKGGCDGIDRNITRALESFQRVHSKHPEASFYIGELLMGMGGLYEMDALSAEGIDSTQTDKAQTPAPLAEIQVDVAQAFQFYSSASARGHVLSTHRMGQIYMWGGAEIEERADLASIEADRLKGIVGANYMQRKSNRRGRGGGSVPVSCENAAAAFKSVAEKGDWAQHLNTAHTLYSAGDRCGALRLFSQLATMGYETAQANAAFILMQSPAACPAWLKPDDAAALAYEAESSEKSATTSSSAAILGVEQWEASRNFSEFIRRESDITPEISSDEENYNVQDSFVREYTLSDQLEARAMSLYRQSALMGNSGSFRKMGDMHYYGRGGLVADKHEAALHYQLAADYGQTHAMFNLGVMHQMGDGVDQDFHLAKRYYDQTAAYDPSARVPSLLAVYCLRVHEEFQLHMGKEVADQVGDFAIQILSPLSQIGDLRNIVMNILFPDHDVTAGAGLNWDHLPHTTANEELSPTSLILWKCWDMFHFVCETAMTTVHHLSEYFVRFTTRFAKSPQQAVSSLISKIKEIVGGGVSDEQQARPAQLMGDSTASTTTPEDEEASADFELILLLTLMVIFLVLLDHRRQRLRAVRRSARERRRAEWDRVTAPELRQLIRNAENQDETPTL